MGSTAPLAPGSALSRGNAQSYSVINNKALLGGGGKWRRVHNQASRETGRGWRPLGKQPHIHRPLSLRSWFWLLVRGPLAASPSSMPPTALSPFPSPRPPPAAVSVRIRTHTPFHPLSAFWCLTPKKRRMGQEFASTEDLFFPQYIQNCRKSSESQSFLINVGAKTPVAAKSDVS